MMDQFSDILDTMRKVTENPGAAVEEFKSMTGRPAIGCAPEYCPEEIIYAAGMLPVGLWGGRTSISQATMYFPAFACSLVQTTLELGMRGVYDNLLSGVIIPAHCDHLKCFGQDWKVAVPQVRFIPLVHPCNRKLEAAVPYLKSEYARIRRALEEIGGTPITDEALSGAIDIYNRHRQALRDFTKVAREYPQTITPVIRHLVIKSGYFMDKELHAGLVKRLMARLQQLPPEEWPGKKVLLTGIMAEPNEFLNLFAENDLAVVADDLAQESRQFRVDVPEGCEPLERLARCWSLMEGCSLLYDPQKKRRFMLKDLAEESGADGVVACIMKFCELEEFDYPLYSKTLESAGIPLLYLEVDNIGRSLEQARTRIQSFAEMLAARSSR
jgi:benzoyl-CoA reductase/2-hydroxyglutaryl-CoA dehydratase subunit BcrC/BadD/HgdB